MDLAYYSGLAMVTSAVLYLLAMVAYAAEWSAARALPAGASAKTKTRVLTGAGGPDVPEAVDQPAAEVSSRIRVDMFGRMGIALTLLAAGSHLGGVVLRGVAAGRAPWGNMYEFVTASLLVVVTVYLVLALRLGMRWLGLPVTLLVTIGQGLAVTVFYVAVSPLMPALHSVWFLIHIVAAAVAGAAFNVGAIASILYLVKSRAEARGVVRGYLAKLPSAKAIDTLAYRMHAFGFPLWTFAVAAGAVWAEYAWGRYWGWDPKETWSLVTWVVYAGYLHARATAGWRGKRAAWIAVVGLATFWFNFVGVNLLISGLHSYSGI